MIDVFYARFLSLVLHRYLFVDDDGSAVAAAQCPRGAVCSGGNAMPRPKRGFWVDRSKVTKAGEMCVPNVMNGFSST